MRLPAMQMQMFGALKRVVGSSKGSFRILKSVALKLKKLKLVDVLHGSEYRRSEFGRETGPVFVTALATEAGRDAVRCGRHREETRQ